VMCILVQIHKEADRSLLHSPVHLGIT